MSQKRIKKDKIREKDEKAVNDGKRNANYEKERKEL
jgi:hypothetical protein